MGKEVGIFRDPPIGWVVLIDEKPIYLQASTVMEILTENNGWAIVWMHEKYFVRHLPPCGTFLRGKATMGCTCKGKFKQNPQKVDDIILAKFRILTLREKME